MYLAIIVVSGRKLGPWSQLVSLTTLSTDLAGYVEVEVSAFQGGEESNGLLMMQICTVVQLARTVF